MNDQIKWRIDFANSIKENLEGTENLTAMFIGGSVARGIADEYSDLELCLVWRNKVSDEKRMQLLDSIDAELFVDFETWEDDLDVIEDNVYINGFQVDIWHNTIQRNQSDIDDVLKSYNTNSNKLNFIETIQNCIPLIDNGVIKDWKKQVDVFPKELQEKIVNENISIFNSFNANIHLARKDWTILYGLISGLQKRVFLILLGVNQMYFPTYKRMKLTLQKMPLKPDGILDYIDEVYSLPPEKAWQDTEKLMLDTLKLVEHELPSIKTEKIHEKISQKRKMQIKSPTTP